MTSDGRGGGSDFIGKGAVIKHLMMGEGSKNGKNHLTLYMVGPLEIYKKKNWRHCSYWWSVHMLKLLFFFLFSGFL